MVIKFNFIPVTIILALFPLHLVAQEKFSIQIDNEHLVFFEEGLYPTQEKYFPSLAGNLQYNNTIGENWNLTVNFFARYDLVDTVRNHVDFRELYIDKSFKKLNSTIGIKKIFWGVTESNHLVDIINQKDYLEGIDRSVKLGELLWQNTYAFSDNHFLNFVLMPLHRIARFPGEKGRLRPPIMAQTNPYFKNAHRYYPSIALRYNSIMSNFEFGLTQFYGVSKSPFLFYNENVEVTFPIIYQVGIDAQYILGPILLKSEIIKNYNEIEDYYALSTGFEYSIGNIGRNTNLSILSEYNYDSRDNQAITGLNNDLFYAARLQFENTFGTEIFFGGVTDIISHTNFYTLKGSSRLTDQLKINIESKLFQEVDNNDLLILFQNDSYIRLWFNLYL